MDQLRVEAEKERPEIEAIGRGLLATRLHDQNAEVLLDGAQSETRNLDTVRRDEKGAN